MSSIQESFQRFHDANPWVYDELVRLLREAKTQRGYTKWSIDGAFNVLRWERSAQYVNDDPDNVWKLNNNFRSRYSRMILDNCPDLEGFIEIRVLKS